MAATSQLDQLKALRWRARTDLQFLCNHILDYPDVNLVVHGPVLKHLQNFPAPKDLAEADAHDQWVDGKWVYRPLKTIWEMDGPDEIHRKLLLDPRGSLKSTINCVAHTIQWIINYPSVTILVMQANLDKAATVLGGIKEHFQRNDTFRALFPEHCPDLKKANDWGTQTEFTTEARSSVSCGGIRPWNQNEATVTAKSLGAGLAGLHFCVMKFSDIVEQGNSENIEQCQKVTRYFGMCRNLPINGRCWTDVEGTRYHMEDLYGKIIQGEAARIKDGKRPRWQVFARGCYLPDLANLGYTDRKYSFEELEQPDKLDARGLPISFWPDRFSAEELEEERNDPAIQDAQFLFNCQRRNLPLDTSSSRPFTKENFHTMERHIFLNVPIAYRTVTVDTADTQNKRSNYSAITTGAWSKAGKLYIEDIIHGKFQPDELVYWLFWTALRARSEAEKPSMYFIEETAYVRGLMAAINRVQDTGVLYIPDSLKEKYGKSRSTGGIRLPITLVPRETDVSKKERILQTLQPWYSSGGLVFLKDIPCLNHALQEFLNFPQATTDDIIDTVADQFQQKDYFGRLKPRFNNFIDFVRIEEERLGQEMIFGEVLGESFDGPRHNGGTHSIPSPYGGDRWGG